MMSPDPGVLDPPRQMHERLGPVSLREHVARGQKQRETAAVGTILISGAAGGIGIALVAELLGAGHEVTGLCRDQDGQARLEAIGGRAVVADLADPASIAASLAAGASSPGAKPSSSGLAGPAEGAGPANGSGTADGAGPGDCAGPADRIGPGDAAGLAGEPVRLDALVHCAGVADIGAVADMQPGSWQRVLAVNVAAAAELTRLLLPALRAARGHVVFVNATPGIRAVPRWSAFVASKAALRELADSLRDEEAEHGVRVTSVYPAATATERLRSIRAGFGRPYDPQRCIQPSSLASMIAWVLAAPPDAYPSELSVLPGPHPAQPG
ncbi:MAG TPA: SDR family NAD(P)-dependent oxidoreductase [Streptosporangiaceae bacterium]